jgi:hypothetical protein
MDRQNNTEKRRRKINSAPVLVRSVKPGQAISAEYTKATHSTSIWKAA